MHRRAVAILGPMYNDGNRQHDVDVFVCGKLRKLSLSEVVFIQLALSFINLCRVVGISIVGISWGILRAYWGTCILGYLEAILGHLWAILGPS